MTTRLKNHHELPSDDELIQALMKYDSAVFERVTDAWYSVMYHIAASIAGESIADEIIQETWVSVMRSLPKFERRSSLKSWVMRILSNEAKTRWRKDSRQVSLEQLDGWNDDARYDQQGHWIEKHQAWHSDSPEDLLQAEELHDCIRKHLGKLPENQRVALTLKESGSHTLEQICNILEVSSSNVRVLMHRARDRILQVIERFEREGKC